MLIVETYLKKTQEKGIGLFAKNTIPSGTIYWERNVEFDKIFTEKEFNSLNIIQKEFISQYGSLEIDGNYYICMDNARFINHADNPNTENYFNKLGILIYCCAKNDIIEDEEILCDYRECCLISKREIGFEIKI